MAGDDEGDDIDADVDVRIRRRRQRIEELHQDMSRNDIIHALRYLNFVDGFSLIRLDHEVRDYLLRALQER